MNQTYDLSYSPAGGGTIAYGGSQTGYLTSPDQGWTPSANSYYSDLAAISIDVTVNGTITAVGVSDASFSYIINGVKPDERVPGFLARDRNRYRGIDTPQ